MWILQKISIELFLRLIDNHVSFMGLILKLKVRCIRISNFWLRNRIIFALKNVRKDCYAVNIKHNIFANLFPKIIWWYWIIWMNIEYFFVRIKILLKCNERKKCQGKTICETVQNLCFMQNVFCNHLCCWLKS